MAVDDAPITELGNPGIASTGGPWGGPYLSLLEEAPELQWPLNTLVYDRMRRTDSQVASVLRAISLPIRRAGVRLEGDDVDPAVIRWLELELGLEAPEGRRRRRREGIAWDTFLRHALLALPLGFMPFEQVYAIGDPPAERGPLPDQVAHLRKLAPRMPRTITDLKLARDGGLEAIVQATWQANKWTEVTIPVDRLVVVTHEQEGADWGGSSILRTAYKNWLIKDALLRLGPVAVERNGMGLPVVTYPLGGDKSLALELARAARAGEDAGVALPEGYLLELKGVTGAVRDELPLLKYHDEAIGRNALAMFLDLGHDAGARALGETFVDYFLLGLNAVTDSIAEVVTEHVIRDLVELNLGPDAPYPELVFDEIEPNTPATAEGIKALVDAGVITPDAELEAFARRRIGAPAAAEVLPPSVDESPWPQVAPTPADLPPSDDPELADLEARLARASNTLAALRAK
jgi:hypothetical protein